MPTEMKIVYDVKNNSLKAEYKYELVYSNDAVKSASDIAGEWFEEVKKGNEQKLKEEYRNRIPHTTE